MAEHLQAVRLQIETAFWLSSLSSTSRDRSSCVATRPRGHQTHRATRHGPRATRPVIFTQVRASWLKRTLPRILHPSCTHLAPILHPRGPRPPRCLSAAVCGATARSLMGMGQAEPLTRLQSIRTPPHTLLHLAPCRPTHYPYKWCSQLVLAMWWWVARECSCDATMARLVLLGIRSGLRSARAAPTASEDRSEATRADGARWVGCKP